MATKALITRYPGDNDIKALYIDGVMTEHAWDMWDNSGKPRPSDTLNSLKTAKRS